MIARALRFAALVASLWLLAGCGVLLRPMTAINIDLDAFTPEQRLAIAAAAFEWYDEVPETTIPFGDGRDPRGGYVTVGTTEKCQGNRLAYTALRVNHAPRIFMCLNQIPDDYSFYLTILHEFGHAFALRGDHLPPGNVMSTAIETDGPPWGELTRADVQYVRDGLAVP